MKSMTGYGSTQSISPELSIEVNLRTVNGRFLDIRCHLPREYFAFEAEIKRVIAQTFKRGTVDLYVNRLLGHKSKNLKVFTRSELATSWLKAYRSLEKSLKLENKDEFQSILKSPEVFTVLEDKSQVSKEKVALFKQINQVVEACDHEREREGNFLKTTLLKHLAQLKEQTHKMQSLKEKANEDLKLRYFKKMEKLKLDKTMDEQRFLQEVALLMDKADINEELERLQEHLDICQNLIKNQDLIGKKLDFYSQELLREINTIGSKSQVVDITQSVVNAKVLVEQFREQVQNVE